MQLPWIAPNIGSRPLALLGAGVLGRRIACVFAAAGYNVQLRDPSADARQAALDYVAENIKSYSKYAKGNRVFGQCQAFPDLESTVHNAWLVIEAVPENLQIKIDTMGELDKFTPPDCILASNSSSFKSRFMLEKVSAQRRQLICNMHFFMPPELRCVELMTDGETNPEVFPYLTKILDDAGMVSVTARKESTGFVFNRLWAAVKREIMTILAEEVSEPKEIDKIWQEMLHSEIGPCAMMDQVGLDTVAYIEDNYINERQLNPLVTVDWLRKNYIEQGKLGNKSDKGGLYPPSTAKATRTNGQTLKLPIAYFLDAGLGFNVQDLALVGQCGQILRRTGDGRCMTVVSGLKCPDGIDFSPSTERMFWTNMGLKPSTNDGSVMSACLDGADVQTVLPEGAVHTPKQLVVDETNHKLYFCDREGLSVHRCDFDGQNHEADSTRWCVGIAVDPKRGKFYWTQKGPSKGSQGRIFRANIDMPVGQTVSNRTDIETLFEGLPEPIDLEIDLQMETLYWTDRGEHPIGNTLNRASVGEKKSQVLILARHFHELIGMKIDWDNQHIYLTDLGGSVYRVNLDGSNKTVLHNDGGSYTGITLV
ncbi:3-hydroxyacyl-CoA dehyrogenase [Penicillium waksmanii]|uniref:3-hydroxyacyl-CoA dehyrogenase n=1 Tax=Penicillium waksmanii TaxID=69791 RepID=UPI002548071D|nr:3-hydroxyacyl-CoA dehyrogenase [Penicillium waksmanii]KAJ6000985.1 3-hydroxyacyl-CoA dehyrogenase [Penicillium waksmanii]